MNRVLLQTGSVFLLCLAIIAGGCDGVGDNDAFDEFEGSWIVGELETADRGESDFNSIKARLDSRYEGNVVFTFERMEGNSEFEIFGDLPDTEDDLLITGDVLLSSSSQTLTLDSQEDVFMDYLFTEDDLLLEADNNDAEALLEVLTGRDYSNDRQVRVTLRRR